MIKGPPTAAAPATVAASARPEPLADAGKADAARRTASQETCHVPVRKR